MKIKSSFKISQVVLLPKYIEKVERKYLKVERSSQYIIKRRYFGGNTYHSDCTHTICFNIRTFFDIRYLQQPEDRVLKLKTRVSSVQINFYSIQAYIAASSNYKLIAYIASIYFQRHLISVKRSEYIRKPSKLYL
ncbi:hypothetical protein RF11_07208 [Thelohanellus kitauei]|uniref:Uncharacterized protein n=1 Tax=Thelohanellus kitauei TaxID=669202 RepID=A0A0C2MTC6_THEKT|nr:hypothetical protein RF11_07208 [Thelohanellus kitauei]